MTRLGKKERGFRYVVAVLCLLVLCLVPVDQAFATGEYSFVDSEGKTLVYDSESNLVINQLVEHEGALYKTDATGAVVKGKFFGFNGQKYYASETGALAKGFITVDGKKYYADENCYVRKNGWLLVDGKYYFANKDGSLRIDEVIWSGSNVYYAGSDGSLTGGIHPVSGKLGYFDMNGKLVKSAKWLQDGTFWYYRMATGILVTGRTYTVNGVLYNFDKDGHLAEGIAKTKDGLHYFDKNGKVRTKAGWIEYNSKWYCAKDGGVLRTNEVFTVGKKTYFAGSTGALSSGVAKYNNKMYYFGSNGEIDTSKTGWIQYDNKWYYAEKGVIATNKAVWSGSTMYYVGSAGTPTGGIYDINGKKAYRYFASNGKCRTKAGWVSYRSKWYYVKKGGVLAQNQFVKENNKYYYLKNNCVMASNEICNTTSGYYYFAKNGATKPANTWVSLNGKWYYTTTYGKLVTNKYVLINKKYYYFVKNGVMKTGWIQDGDKWYYAKSSGALAYKEYITVNGKKYYADDKYVVAEPNSVSSKAQNYSSNTDYLILVDTTNQKTYVFKGSKGKWAQQKAMTCSTGTSSNSTPLGEYKTTMRTRYFDSFGYRCWYATGFIGGEYLFHSSPYILEDKPNRIADSTMGVPSSHGCIRMTLDDALYIYDNIPIGSKVVIF